MVEIGPERHIVLQLTSGAIFPEGLLATYGAVCRAETNCEVYRVRWHDFYMAVGLSTPTPNDWFWKFRVQEKETVERLTRRLQSVQGLLDVNLPHAKDVEIKAWRDQRGQRMIHARRNGDQEAIEAALQRLPYLSQDSGIQAKAAKKQAFAELKKSTRTGNWEAKSGLLAYSGSSLLLPKLEEPGKLQGGLHASKSEPALTEERPQRRLP